MSGIRSIRFWDINQATGTRPPYTDRKTNPTCVQTTENYIKNATNTSALAQFICVYFIETAPQIVKEHQWIMLTGGFNNGQLVKVVEHTGVREQPEMFSAHEEADTRILLHTIGLATTHSRLIVRCDDTNRLVFLIYYRGKCTFAKCKVYMNADVHSCQQDSIEHLARCLALPANQPHMLHQRYSGCDTTSSLFKIGKRIAYNMLVVNIDSIGVLAST